MKLWELTFTNTSGILNPDLGMLNDGGYTFRQWQQRMRSYLRGHSDRPRNRHHGNHNDNINKNNLNNGNDR